MNNGMGTPDYSVETIEAPISEAKFGMIDLDGVSVPSLVSETGAPFSWRGEPLIVRNISGGIAVVMLKTGEEKSYTPFQIQWGDDNRPVVLSECLVQAPDGWHTPFDDEEESQKTISLISPSGMVFETLDVKSPIIHRNNYGKKTYYYVTREDGDFRVFRALEKQRFPGEALQYLAVKEGEDWELVKRENGSVFSVIIPQDSPIMREYYSTKESGELLCYQKQSGSPAGKLSNTHRIILEDSVSIESVSVQDSGWMASCGSQHTIYTGTVGEEKIQFCLDSSGRADVEHMLVNDTHIFHDHEGKILAPENLKNKTIRPGMKVENLKGFEGVMLCVLRYDDTYFLYTDGKKTYKLRGIPEKPKTYNNPSSPYHGYLLSPWGHGIHGAVVSGENGRDFARLITKDGELILLNRNGKESVVSMKDRSEDSTNHAINLDLVGGSQIAQLYPKLSLVVLCPNNDNREKYYRYYGIGIDNELTFLGTKDNIVVSDQARDATFIFKTDNSRNASLKQGTILLGTQNESRAFMINGATFLPVMAQGGDPILLHLQSVASGNLTAAGHAHIPIPSEWIVNGKILEEKDFRSLLQFFPGTDKLYVPGKYGIVDMKGVRMEPTVPVGDIPVLRFGENSYYICSDRSFDTALWNPGDDTKRDVPSLYSYRTAPSMYQTYPGTAGLTETASGEYLYPASPRLPKDVRMVLFTGKNKLPTWSHVWYDQETNTTAPFTDTNGAPVYFQEYPNIHKDMLVFSTDTSIQAFNITTREPISFPQYSGLSLVQKRDGTLGYVTPKQEEVAYDESGKPREILVDGVSWYVLEDGGNFYNWFPYLDIPELTPVIQCYLPSKNITTPFVLRGGNYIPAIALPEDRTNSSVRLTGGSIFIGKNRSNTEECYYSVEAIGKLPGEDEVSIIIHYTIYESGEYAIAYGRTVSELLNPTSQKKDSTCPLYLLYKSGDNTLCILLKEPISRSEHMLTIGQMSYDIDDDAPLLAGWLETLARKYIPVKVTTESIVRKQKGAVGSVLKGKTKKD